MREIKFRGKRVDNGEWITGCLLIDYITGQYYIHANGNSVNESDKVGEEGYLKFVAFEVNPETVCQYTGLEDKNGVEIYESDIVKLPDDYGLYIVEWDERWARFIMYSEEQRYITKFSVHGGNEVEVVGNVWDNPRIIGGNKMRIEDITEAIANDIEKKILGDWKHEGCVDGFTSENIYITIDEKKYRIMVQEEA